MIGPKEPEATDSAENEVLQSKIFDHLGLVAGMFEELEIGDRIDEQIAQDFEERNVSIGQAVKALILTGLGFVQQRLYLTAQFFEKMPTDRLIGEEVRPEHLNDDVLGRALDDLYDYGVTELFRDLAAHAAQKLGLSSRFAHLGPASRLRAITTPRPALPSLPKTALFASSRAIRETIAQTSIRSFST